MILVRKIKLIFYIIFTAVFFLALSFYSYSLLSGSDSFGSGQAKYYAEKIFLAGVAGSLFLLLYGTGIISKSRRFEKSLDKLLVMSRNTGRSPDEGLRKLGKTGVQIADILAELDRIGAMRALRISAFDALLRIVMKTAGEIAAVVDSKGEILYCTDSFAGKYGKKAEEVCGHMIDVFVEDREIKALLEGAVVSHREIQMKDGTIYPVINRANEAVWCFCVFGTTPGGVSLGSIRESRGFRKMAESGGKAKKVFDFFRNRVKK